MHADQGTSVTTSSATAQRKEERREWKLYLYPWHSVYFGWQTRLALRTVASNELWPIPSLRIPFRPDIVSVRLCHVSPNMSLRIKLGVDFFMENDYRVLIVARYAHLSDIRSLNSSAYSFILNLILGNACSIFSLLSVRTKINFTKNKVSVSSFINDTNERRQITLFL